MAKKSSLFPLFLVCLALVQLVSSSRQLDDNHNNNRRTNKDEAPLISALSTTSLESSAWPTYRGNVQNTGQSIYSGPMGSSVSATKLFTSSSVSTLPIFTQVTSPAIDSSGNIYFFGCTGPSYGPVCDYLVSVSSSGSYLWSTYLSAVTSGLYSSPAIGNDGTIYVCTGYYGIAAISSSGTITWSGSSFGVGLGLSSPTIDSSGNIYYISLSGTASSGFQGYLNAVSNTGTLKWSYFMPVSGSYTGYSYSSPAMSSDGTTIYFNTFRGSVYAVSTSGTKTWSYYSNGDIFYYGSVAVGASGTIYTGSNNGFLYAIIGTGTLKWKYSVGYNIADNTPAVSSIDETIYISDFSNANLYAISDLGTLMWTYTATTGIGFVSSSTIGSNGTIYFTSTYGSVSTVYGISNSGTKLWSTVPGGDLRNCDPVIGSNAILYVASATGVVSSITRSTSTSAPTVQPTPSPSRQPTPSPSKPPTPQPTVQGQPSAQPSSQPSGQPSVQPSSQPTSSTMAAASLLSSFNKLVLLALLAIVPVSVIVAVAYRRYNAYLLAKNAVHVDN